MPCKKKPSNWKWLECDCVNRSKVPRMLQQAIVFKVQLANYLCYQCNRHFIDHTDCSWCKSKTNKNSRRRKKVASIEVKVLYCCVLFQTCKCDFSKIVCCCFLSKHYGFYRVIKIFFIKTKLIRWKRVYWNTSDFFKKHF